MNIFSKLFGSKKTDEVLEDVQESHSHAYTKYSAPDTETVKFEECDDFRGLVVKDGIIVGIILKSLFGEDKVCLPGQKMTTYWSSDGDGVGSTDRDDTCCLICV